MKYARRAELCRRTEIVIPSHKRCHTCKTVKSSEAFYPDARVLDGLDNQCKPCKKISVERLRQRRKARDVVELPHEATCISCGETKLADEFTLSKANENGLCAYCKTCQHARDTKHYGDQKTNNPVMRRIKQMVYSSRSHQREKTGPLVNNLTFDYLWREFSHVTHCPDLGIKLDWTASKTCPASPSLDRIIPELGYVEGNVRIISYKANTMKNSANLQEMQTFAASMQKLAAEQTAKIAAFYVNPTPPTIPQPVLDILAHYVTD